MKLYIRLLLYTFVGCQLLKPGVCCVKSYVSNVPMFTNKKRTDLLVNVGGYVSKRNFLHNRPLVRFSLNYVPKSEDCIPLSDYLIQDSNQIYADLKCDGDWCIGEGVLQPLCVLC